MSDAKTIILSFALFAALVLGIWVAVRDTPEEAAAEERRKAERQAHIEEIKQFAPACWISSGHLQSWGCVSAVADKKLVEQMEELRVRLDRIEQRLEAQ